MNTPILTVSDLIVNIDQKNILSNISFVVNKNETLAIIGPNGAGKTTLFRALLGLISYKGVINWKHGIKIGYVPQKLYIEPDFPLTVEEFFLIKKTNPTEIRSTLNSVGLTKNINEILGKKLSVLSGGELQRILIAWGLIGNPDVLLFDEPTSGIDISSEETIYSLLKRLQKNKALTIILISHEIQVVYQYATNVLCLNKDAVCYGAPNNALNQESLKRLFGGEVGIYQHH